MKIIRNEELATLTFVPVEKTEERVIASIATTLKPENRLFYDGRGQDGGFCILYFNAGGRKEMQTKMEGGSKVTRYVYIGGIKLVLRGTTEEDDHEVKCIRNMCYFGSGGLIFIGETEVDGKKAIITTGLRCRLCGSGMIHYHDCSRKTCDQCD